MSIIILIIRVSPKSSNFNFFFEKSAIQTFLPLFFLVVFTIFVKEHYAYDN